MKKLLLLIFFGLTLNAYAAQIIRGPYLENPTPTAMTLRWQTSAATPSWLEYGPAPRCNQIMTLTPQAYNHKVVLYGLVPNQDYCYHLYVENAAHNGVQEPISGTFRTLFSPERKVVTFLVMGSTAEDPVEEDDSQAQARAQIATLMAQEKADFVLHTGNLTHSGLNADADAELFKPFEEVFKNLPLLVALGPNEYGPDKKDRESKDFVRTNYTRYHDMPWSNATPKYYYFDTANARFIVLDTNIVEGAVWAPEMGADSAQTQWLKTTLAQAGDKWKIVLMNAPAYSTGLGGSSQEVYDNWVKIFEDYRVNLVLQGGDANYERTFPLRAEETHPRGVTYVTVGTSAETPGKRASNEKYTARFVSTRHYAVGKIVDRKLTLTVYSDTGKQLDKLEMYL
ncbi:MAG: metallophosphoesterase [Elusimicrobiaceae bacterium]|nr:metallophosphoesterase [Elusimicrobiaceae bacterium]